MSLAHTASSSRFARLLVLATLLLACNVQALEQAHFHAADDNPVHCLLCQGGATDSIHSSIPAPFTLGVARGGYPPPAIYAKKCKGVQPLARGPPPSPVQ